MPDAVDAGADDAPSASAKSGAGSDRGVDGLPETQSDTIIGCAVTINRPHAELFGFWRDFSHLASFMENVVRVDVIDPLRSHWVVKAPGGHSVEWDARITEERDGELIAWASDEGADVTNSGRIEFREAGDRGTVVTATIAYDPPAGIVGKVVAKLFQREPAIQARRDLRRFKQLMETGEIATSARTRAEHDEEKD